MTEAGVCMGQRVDRSCSVVETEHAGEGDGGTILAMVHV